jgi:hypothetical protein
MEHKLQAIFKYLLKRDAEADDDRHQNKKRQIH